MGTSNSGNTMTIVTLETSHGDIVIELNDEKAPETVKNFLNYVNDGFYDGTIFHRVIPNFMVQGGGFMPGMVQKRPEDPIKNEADNGLTNDRGTVAMLADRCRNIPHSKIVATVALFRSSARRHDAGNLCPDADISALRIHRLADRWTIEHRNRLSILFVERLSS